MNDHRVLCIKTTINVMSTSQSHKYTFTKTCKNNKSDNASFSIDANPPKYNVDTKSKFILVCVFTKSTKCIYNFIKGCFAAKSDKWLFIVCIKSLNLKSMPSACPLSWDWFLSSNSPLCSIQMIFCNKSFKCNNDSSTSLSTYCLWQLGNLKNYKQTNMFSKAFFCSERQFRKCPNFTQEGILRWPPATNFFN